jgi:orsellinic acid C2-O-methyltransferase
MKDGEDHMTDATDQPPSPLLLQMIFGFFPTQVLYVAARLRVPDLVAAGAMSSEELAEATGTHPPSLYRLLRALAYLGILEETEPSCFGLTELGAPLRSDAAESVWATTLLFCGDGVWRSWGELLISVRTGETAFDKSSGTEPFAHFAENPEASETFNQAMSEGTRRDAPGIIRSYDFGQFQTLVDVGGGDGTLLAAILGANPGLHGVLFDSASGLAQAPNRLEAGRVGDRCQLVEGDFFASVPGDADAYILKSVIHDWDDERCVTILKNCHRSMAGGAKVLIVEPVLPPTVEPSFTRLGVIMSDLNMLLNTGGRERTEAEFATLLRSAGLELTAVVPTPPPSVYSIIEAVAR